MFNFFKRKRLRTLGDVDNLTLENADQLFNNSTLPEIDKMLEEQYLCRTCKGDLTLVIPEIKLGGMYLFECRDCRERFYV